MASFNLIDEIKSADGSKDFDEFWSGLPKTSIASLSKESYRNVYNETIALKIEIEDKIVEGIRERKDLTSIFGGISKRGVVGFVASDFSSFYDAEVYKPENIKAIIDNLKDNKAEMRTYLTELKNKAVSLDDDAKKSIVDYAVNKGVEIDPIDSWSSIENLKTDAPSSETKNIKKGTLETDDRVIDVKNELSGSVIGFGKVRETTSDEAKVEYANVGAGSSATIKEGSYKKADSYIKQVSNLKEGQQATITAGGKVIVVKGSKNMAKEITKLQQFLADNADSINITRAGENIKITATQIDQKKKGDDRKINKDIYMSSNDPSKSMSDIANYMDILSTDTDGANFYNANITIDNVPAKKFPTSAFSATPVAPTASSTSASPSTSPVAKTKRSMKAFCNTILDNGLATCAIGACAGSLIAGNALGTALVSAATVAVGAISPLGVGVCAAVAVGLGVRKFVNDYKINKVLSKC
ncbi:MAG: hypothetical protein E7361_03555 [Clostridiales bacterium]|nr:hypothetical protein [Clostridiales bacterium]